MRLSDTSPISYLPLVILERARKGWSSRHATQSRQMAKDQPNLNRYMPRGIMSETKKVERSLVPLRANCRKCSAERNAWVRGRGRVNTSRIKPAALLAPRRSELGEHADLESQLNINCWLLSRNHWFSLLQVSLQWKVEVSS